MEHRHLEGENFSLESIDDIISRGKWDDWVELREKALSDPSVLDDIAHICANFISDPYEQRYHFWMNYVKKWRQTN
ncbi:MAG: hypothetical protein LBF38_11140 [Deltaproteobacteria bacterium]|jgi:hypothetical protein|nr:hypothetical protein [Deltaproteobacteria bacterium]